MDTTNMRVRQEINLSRSLARAIENNLDQVPDEVKQAYYKLFELYQIQIEEQVV